MWTIEKQDLFLRLLYDVKNVRVGARVKNLLAPENCCCFISLFICLCLHILFEERVQNPPSPQKTVNHCCKVILGWKSTSVMCSGLKIHTDGKRPCFMVLCFQKRKHSQFVSILRVAGACERDHYSTLMRLYDISWHHYLHWMSKSCKLKARTEVMLLNIV